MKRYYLVESVDWTRIVQKPVIQSLSSVTGTRCCIPLPVEGPAINSCQTQEFYLQLFDTIGWRQVHWFALQDEKWFSTNSNATINTDSMEISCEQYLVSTPEANLSNFVEMAEICPSTSQENSTQKTSSEVIHVLPVKNGPNFVCADRNSVISRYKEKRKARRWV